MGRTTTVTAARPRDAETKLALAQRPPLSLQYAVRLPIRRLLDEHEGQAITFVTTNHSAKRGKR